MAGSFEPIVVPKHQSMAPPLENIIISLYAKGMSVSDIEEELYEIYGYKLSTSAISITTDKVNQRLLDWQNRPLESVYCVVWMDGIVFKVRQAGKVINKTIYLAVGLNREGYKELLGIWLGQNESASFYSPLF
ncbi:transposase [uncultured Tenacibaculum sp.]|uniref:transposase n=1 Tax=uncultured Tenacibaculum sp. TaxID=174713 RepID=UPI00260FE288|nr:transposase [uncultured Tenacibaculum sp.]